MSDLTDSKFYDAYYYQHGCGVPYERSNPHWLKFFGGIADKIVSGIRPRSMLDAGCAMGFLVECLRDRGVEAFGVDLSDYAIAQVRADLQPHCWVGSVFEPFPRRYDLIVCIEVLEHLRQPESEQAIANFCQHADDILFSSTPLDYKETTHFNVQPPEYWAEQFAQHGFVRDVDFDASFITPWAVRFRGSREPLARVIRDYERRFWLLWKENTDLRGLTGEMRDQLASAEQTLTAKTAESEQARQSLHESENALLVYKQETQTLQAQLQDITHRPAYRLVQRLQRFRAFLAPPGSYREEFLNLLVQVFVEPKRKPG
jgi:SAM-dependent methyltransferase